ncbi:hypothetical protein C8Q75DRAFT_811519 [Abortiporus biennis]|nr:hypothetical protein C8Q75DRAFT_811519 [Abortiporus biennis]
MDRRDQWDQWDQWGEGDGNMPRCTEVAQALLPPREMFKRYQAITSSRGKSSFDGAKFSRYAIIQSDPTLTIYDGRLPENPKFITVAPPIQIFHPVFHKFQFRCTTATPSKETIEKTFELMQLLAKISDSERRRSLPIRELLSEILGVPLVEEMNVDRIHPDTVYAVEVEGGGLSMRRAWIQENRKDVTDKCSCPTLILAGGGPWIGILGSSTHQLLEMQGSTGLHKCSPRFQSQENAPQPRFYPYKTTYTNIDGETVHFEYEGPMEAESVCVTYLARIIKTVDKDGREIPVPDGAPPRKVVVKFADRYGIEVHKFLGKEKHGPSLLNCEPLYEMDPYSQFLLQLRGEDTSNLGGISLGPIQMIVMEYVQGVKLGKRLSKVVRSQIEAVLHKLHRNGFVFGDLRMPNILLNDKGEVQFIDFNWCGRFYKTVKDELPENILKLIPKDVYDEMYDGQNQGTHIAHYPVTMSERVFEPARARKLTAIRPLHDWLMLESMQFAD